MKQIKKVTVIYYADNSLELLHEVGEFEVSNNERVIIPQAFKLGKSIIAVCDGEINILNKVGDRILSVEQLSEQLSGVKKFESV